MTRDYSEFLGADRAADGSKPQPTALQRLGWQPWFAQQISADDITARPPVRVVEVHRSGLHVIGNDIDTTLPPRADVTVGDWLLLDRTNMDASLLLERKSLLKRRAPGPDRQVQLIAANIDTAFIVTSCNQDFNVARLERYLALALEADITPVIILTKSDLVEDAAHYVQSAAAISDLVPVVTLDARGDDPREKLAEWCRPGHTVAFLGSSGVGKSTLTNALAGTQEIETQAIREADARGRHTTTRRQLHIVPGGCIVLDTPGMREVQMTDVASGIDDLFADLHALSMECKFNDCRHETEPGCAIRAALAAGEIDEARLARWRKLKAEEAFNSASLAERRYIEKSFGKLVRNVQKIHKKRD